MSKKKWRSVNTHVIGLFSCVALSGYLCACGKEKPTHEVLNATKENLCTDETVNEKEEGIRSDQMNENDAKLFEKLETTESFKGLGDTNPCMTQRFGADPYAMVYQDRVYLYMTGDTFEYDTDGNVKENTYSKIDSIQVISTNDMVNFTDHGTIKAASALGAAKWASNSWAPAAAWKEIDGEQKFFLYFADSARGIGVLTADDPAGPYVDPLGHALITKKTSNCSDIEWLFDPAVLVDDDGRAYLYFGGGVPQDKIARPGTARVVELGADMISIIGEPKVIDVPYLFEDSGIHKSGNKYYYTYCTNWQVDQKGTDEFGFRNGEIASMVSDSPMGPFVYKERILKNPGEYFGLYGNNHHCVFQFKENWYMAYHTRTLEKAMGLEKGYRCTHIDSFTIEEDGTIGVIKQTLKGREQLGYVDPYEENKAVNFAVMGGIGVVGADNNSSNNGCGNMALSDIHTGDFIMIGGVDFGAETPKSFEAGIRRTSIEKSVMQIRIDGLDGQILGYLEITGDVKQSFTKQVCTLLTDNSVTGIHDLFILFYGEGYELENWKFYHE